MTRPPSHSTKSVHWIIDLIREWRVNRGLGQKEFAEQIAYMTPAAWANYEMGHNKMTQLHTIEGVLNRMGYEIRLTGWRKEEKT